LYGAFIGILLVGAFGWPVYAWLQDADRTAPTNQLMFFVELAFEAEA